MSVEILDIVYSSLEIDQQRIDDTAATDSKLSSKINTQSLGSPTGVATLTSDGKHDSTEIPFSTVLETDDSENDTTVISPKRLHYIVGRDAVSVGIIGEANGIAPLDPQSKIDPLYLPATQHISTFVVTTLADMYALVGLGNLINVGDRCVVTNEPTFLAVPGDYNGEYVANVLNPTDASGWDQLPNLSSVASVNGDIGDVVITSIAESAQNAIDILATNSAVDATEVRLDDVEADIVTANAAIGINAGNITSNLTLIESNDTDIATNLSSINTLNTRAPFVPVYEYTTVTAVTVTDGTYEAINSHTIVSADAGTYRISMSMIYTYDQLNKSAYFQFSKDGGNTWTEIRKEPKDNSDKVPMNFDFSLVHVSGDLDIQMQAHKEDGLGVMEIVSHEITVERKL